MDGRFWTLHHGGEEDGLETWSWPEGSRTCRDLLRMQRLLMRSFWKEIQRTWRSLPPLITSTWCASLSFSKVFENFSASTGLHQEKDRSICTDFIWVWFHSWILSLFENPISVFWRSKVCFILRSACFSKPLSVTVGISSSLAAGSTSCRCDEASHRLNSVVINQHKMGLNRQSFLTNEPVQISNEPAILKLEMSAIWETSGLFLTKTSRGFTSFLVGVWGAEVDLKAGFILDRPAVHGRVKHPPVLTSHSRSGKRKKLTAELNHLLLHFYDNSRFSESFFIWMFLNKQTGSEHAASLQSHVRSVQHKVLCCPIPLMKNKV